MLPHLFFHGLSLIEIIDTATYKKVKPKKPCWFEISGKIHVLT